MILAIYCAGSFGREIVSLAKKNNRWDDIIFVDDVTDQDSCEGIKVFKFDELENKEEKSKIEFLVASGEPWSRRVLRDKIKSNGYRMSKLIADDFDMISNVTIGEGTIVYPGCRMSTYIDIGENVVLGPDVRIADEVAIGSDSFLSTRAFVGGITKIEERVFVGPGSMIKGRVSIGEDSIIGIGAVIFRNVRKKSIMIGNPAKRIGENTQNKVFDMFD